MSRAHNPPKAVLLIGTHHTYQYGVGSTYGVVCTAEDESAFRHLIQSTAARFTVHGLAEEMNDDGLAEHSVSKSVLQLQAAALGLPHCFCEPGRAERTALGIRQENDVRFQGWMSNWSDEEVTRHLLGEFRKRETVWCDRLLSFDKWPVLFVCGANHVESFSSLLAERGLSVEVLESCWEAKP